MIICFCDKILKYLLFFYFNFSLPTNIIKLTSSQVIDIYLSAYGGAAMYFADKKALQGTLIQTLQEARPTRFFGKYFYVYKVLSF